WHFLGAVGAAAIRAFFRLSRWNREIVGAGAGLSELRKPRRDRKIGRAAGGRRFVAARSRWRAALSGLGEIAAGGEAREVVRIGRALCPAARYGGSRPACRRSRLGRARPRAEWGNWPGRRPTARLG